MCFPSAPSGIFFFFFLSSVLAPSDPRGCAAPVPQLRCRQPLCLKGGLPCPRVALGAWRWAPDFVLACFLVNKYSVLQRKGMARYQRFTGSLDESPSVFLAQESFFSYFRNLTWERVSSSHCVASNQCIRHPLLVCISGWLLQTVTCVYIAL